MRILIVGDTESPALWDFFTPEKVKGVDLILSCGDVKADYLRFLVTMAGCPLLYVHGNHDDSFLKKAPEGCVCIDEQAVVYRGIRIAGLGGCRKYSGGAFQYTEDEKEKSVRKLQWAIHAMEGVDIVLTHCPPEGLGDSEDYAHRGFACYRSLIEKEKPKYFIHGHVHMNYGHGVSRILSRGDTTIINGYERFILEVPDVPYNEKNKYDVMKPKTGLMRLFRKKASYV